MLLDLVLSSATTTHAIVKMDAFEKLQKMIGTKTTEQNALVPGFRTSEGLPEGLDWYDNFKNYAKKYNEWSSELSKFRAFQDRWLKYYMTFEHAGSKYAFIGDLYGNFNRNTTVSFNSFVVVQYDYKFPYLRSSPIRL